MKTFTLIIRGRKHIVSINAENKTEREVESILDNIATDIMNA